MARSPSKAAKALDVGSKVLAGFAIALIAAVLVTTWRYREAVSLGTAGNALNVLLGRSVVERGVPAAAEAPVVPGAAAGRAALESRRLTEAAREIETRSEKLLARAAFERERRRFFLEVERPEAAAGAAPKVETAKKTSRRKRSVLMMMEPEDIAKLVEQKAHSGDQSGAFALVDALPLPLAADAIAMVSDPALKLQMLDRLAGTEAGR